VGASTSTLAVGGLTPLTTIDFPGRLAAVVFCQGCPWRCRYCQNTHLLPPTGPAQIPWEEVLAFLERRRGLLDGVAFSGGEPTLQGALPQALAAVRSLGFETGLHTAGIYPERLAAVLPLLDWVGIDIKAPPAGYAALTGAGPRSGERAWRSLELVLASGIPCEVRTTVHPELLPPDQILALAQELADAGVTDYALQECLTGRCLDPGLSTAVPGRRLQAPITTALAELFPRLTLRAA
jgi:pyruvate formate lyase activating enzyme